MQRFTSTLKSIDQVSRHFANYKTDNKINARDDHEVRCAISLIIRGFPSQPINYIVEKNGIIGAGNYVLEAVRRITKSSSNVLYDYSQKCIVYAENEHTVPVSTIISNYDLFKFTSGISEEHARHLEEISNGLCMYTITLNEIYKQT